MANVHDNQQEDINSNCDQTGQGRSQPSTESRTNTTAAVLASGDYQTGQAQSPTVAILSRNKVLAALKPNPMYPDVETTPKSAGIASSHDQAGQGQSNTITESTHTYTVMVSYDQPGQGQSHVITESNTHTTCASVASGNDLYYEDVDNHRVKTGQDTYTVMASSHDRPEQDQPHVNTESNTHTTCAAVASGNDHHYEDVDNHRVKTGQGPRNSSSHDQAGQDQSNAIAKSNTRTYTVTASSHDQTEQDQPHVITESNTHTTYAAVASGKDHHYEDVDNHRVKTVRAKFSVEDAETLQKHHDFHKKLNIE
ncbi:Bax inhibitor 1 [Branchiostoma belcheri]|nr:Bax inhibitor 1 [Branchiostoma belcheri]